jgi:multiple sugar transport system substrate-binding protein
LKRTRENKRYSGSRPRRRMNRRQFLKLGGAGLAGASLLGGAACGPLAPEENDVTNIVFSFGPTGDEDLRTVENLVENFNREYEGEIQAEFRRMPSATDEYFDELVSELRNGGGEIDVIGGDVIWTAELAQNDWIEDITRRVYRDYPLNVPDAFLEAPLTSCSYRNRLYGVPWFTDAGLLYYRADLLEEAGFSEPPATWEELTEMARQIQQDAGVRFGFVFQGDEYEGGTVNGCEFIWNAGGRILTGTTLFPSPGAPPTLDPNAVVIDNPRSILGLEIQRGTVEDGVAPEEVASYQEEQCQDAFFAGDAVFMRGWPFMYALTDEPDSEVGAEQVGIAALPVAEEGNQSFSCLGGWNMLINAASQNQDAAWEFIKFATSPEQQRIRALEGSFLPSLHELYEDQEIQDEVPVIGLGRDIIEQNLRTRPVTPFYSEITEVLAEGFNTNLRGETDPAETASSLQQGLERVIRGN